MENPQISRDDVTDVMEMTEKLEKYISKLFKGNDINLCFSSLIGAFINCVFSQCRNMKDVHFYRNAFIEILDNSIKSIQFDE